MKCTLNKNVLVYHIKDCNVYRSKVSFWYYSKRWENVQSIAGQNSEFIHSKLPRICQDLSARTSLVQITPKENGGILTNVALSRAICWTTTSHLMAQQIHKNVIPLFQFKGYHGGQIEFRHKMKIKTRNEKGEYC